MAALSSSGCMGEDGCTPAEPRPAALRRGTQGWDRGRAGDCSGHHREVCLCCVTRAQHAADISPTFKPLLRRIRLAPSCCCLQGKYVCTAEPPHPPAVIPRGGRGGRWGLKSHRSGAQHGCERWEEPCGGTARGCGLRCCGREAPDELWGDGAGEERQRSRGSRLGFFGKGLPGSLLVPCQAPESAAGPSLSRALKIRPETKTYMCV